MLRNMSIGVPEGNYDRILDFSTGITGGLFFAPTADFLEDPTIPTAHESGEVDDTGADSTAARSHDESLGVGNLRTSGT